MKTIWRENYLKVLPSNYSIYEAINNMNWSSETTDKNGGEGEIDDKFY